jgi:hypothetical protein
MTHRTCTLFFGALTVAILAMAGATGAWAQSEKILHTFTNGSDGGSPIGSLIFDSKGTSTARPRPGEMP